MRISFENYNISKPFKPMSFKSEPVSSSLTLGADFSEKRDKAIVDYIEITKKRESQNQLLSYLGLAVCFGTIPLLLWINKRGNSSRTRVLDRSIDTFKSLKDNKEIPTLENCKSIDKKLSEFLKNQITYANASPADIQKTGMPNPSNRLILYGAPGTGKSFFAKIYAKTMDAYYKEVLFSDFNSRWAGEGTENLAAIFEDILKTAKKSPEKKYVVTLNEIDTMVQPAEKISNTGNGGGSYYFTKLEQRSTFLNYIDRIADETPNVTIIGTTNLSPKNNGLDGAAMSRFKNLMEVPYPDKTCLLEALKAQLKELALEESFIKTNENALNDITERMIERKCSYRDLNNLINTSKSYYLNDYMKNKDTSFKIEYMQKALKNIDLTDGEIAGSTVQRA